MNINKIKNLCIVSLALVFAACEPIVDEKFLSPTTDVAGVELVATQSTEGGNGITLNMVTPGITGYWDYNLGTALTDKVSFVYPIPGTSTFTYTGTLGDEFFTKTIDVQIDQLDQALDQDWYDLVSEDTAGGKTWVYAATPGNGAFWFMSAPGSPDNAWSMWWNAGDCCCPDASGKIHFDLDGAANYTYDADGDGTGDLGGFVLDVANQRLKITGQPLMGGNVDGGAGNVDGIYEIVTLTEDEMVLYIANSEAYGTGWTWVFKPEGM